MDENKLVDLESKVDTLWKIHTWGISLIVVGLGVWLITKKYGK